MSIVQSTKKFKALVHFMVHECRDNPAQLGAIRLSKTLWFTDMLAYQILGKPATEEKYLKRRMGPVPATIESTLKELEDEGKIQREHDRFISRSSPDESLIPVQERRLAERLLEMTRSRTADEISEMSHSASWEAASEGEEIPLCATLVTEEGAITEEAVSWASAIVQQRESAGIT